MHFDRNFWSAILFFFLTIICIFGLLTHGVQSYYITGLVIFTFLGVAFILRAMRKR